MAYICERLSFAQLYGFTDQGRRDRSRSVRGPALELESSRGNQTYNFNFRAYPSTQGKRHQGYVRFFKPSNPNIPLDRLECEVGCGCLDYRYVHSWANKQRGSSQVGPMSISKTINRAPRIKNPSNKPGLCKHLSRVRDYIVNKLYGGQGRTIDKLDRLVTLTQRPVVLGGKRVDQAKTPSTKLPPKKPTNPWMTASTAQTESVVNIMRTADLKDWSKLFEDDSTPSGIVSTDTGKLDQVLELVRNIQTGVEKLTSKGTDGALDDEDEAPIEGAIELDLGTGDPKGGEEVEIKPDEEADEECPPCNRDDLVPEAPDAEDLAGDQEGAGDLDTEEGGEEGEEEGGEDEETDLDGEDELDIEVEGKDEEDDEEPKPAKRRRRIVPATTDDLSK